MSFSIDEKKLEQCLVMVEKGLNWVGYFTPLGAGYRAMLGTLQVVASFFSILMKTDPKDWRAETTHIIHGMANVFRSSVESHLFFPLSLVLAVWDFKGIRLKYDVEESGGMDGLRKKGVEWIRSGRNKINEILQRG